MNAIPLREVVPGVFFRFVDNECDVFLVCDVREIFPQVHYPFVAVVCVGSGRLSTYEGDEKVIVFPEPVLQDPEFVL